MPSRMWTTSAGLTAVLVVAGCVSLGTLPDYAPGPTASASAVPEPSTEPEPSPAAPVVPADSGPTTFASGHAEEIADGQYSYVVAEGDTPSAIAARFGVCTLDVLESNPPQDPWLVVGQTIDVQRVTDIPLGTYDCEFDVDTL